MPMLRLFSTLNSEKKVLFRDFSFSKALSRQSRSFSRSFISERAARIHFTSRLVSISISRVELPCITRKPPSSCPLKGTCPLSFQTSACIRISRMICMYESHEPASRENADNVPIMPFTTHSSPTDKIPQALCASYMHLNAPPCICMLHSLSSPTICHLN